MKRLGAYISSRADTWASSLHFTKGCFVYYEYITGIECSRINIWRLDALLDQAPDEVIYLRSPDHLKAHIEPHESWANHHISYHDRIYRIRNMACRYARDLDIEIIDALAVDAVDHYETWSHEGHHSAIQFLKESKLTDLIHYKKPNLTMPDTVGDMIKEEIKKSIEQAVMKDILYGTGSFTTNADPFKVVKIAEKETTMEKNMTLTDKFMKSIDGISITSTHASIQNGPCKCDIYYPEIKITPKIAEELMVILLDMEKNWTNKVIFNPEKGTTSIACRKRTITVKCKDAEFSFLTGYMMARCKTLHGCDDYNWFNKIMNHRKTHIEYATPERPKRGGKKS